MSPETLKLELFKLPPAELAKLVREAMLYLGDSKALDLLFKSDESKDEIEKLWFEEATRRAEAIDKGKMKLIPSKEANQRIKATLERLQNQNHA